MGPNTEVANLLLKGGQKCKECEERHSRHYLRPWNFALCWQEVGHYEYIHTLLFLHQIQDSPTLHGGIIGYQALLGPAVHYG
jgi:hypothetical protein